LDVLPIERETTDRIDCSIETFASMKSHKVLIQTNRHFVTRTGHTLLYRTTRRRSKVLTFVFAHESRSSGHTMIVSINECIITQLEYGF